MMMRIRISDYVHGHITENDICRPTPDPLQADDALLEATLLSGLHFPLISAYGFLFDLRTSVYFSMDNTCVVLFRQVIEVKIDVRPLFTPYVWTVIGSRLTKIGSELNFELGGVWDKGIGVRALYADCLVGNVADIGNIAATIDNGLIIPFLETTPSWNSHIEVTNASKLP